MQTLVTKPHAPPLPPAGPAPLVIPGTEPDERAARKTLRDQIGKLERQLAAAFVARRGHMPDGPVPIRPRYGRGARLLSLAELEELRDELAARLSHMRGEMSVLAELQEEKRLLVEKMLLEPGRYKWVRVTNEDIGEEGCRSWHVKPRLGLIGMLAGWWQVKISSGCPLAGGSRRVRGPAPGNG